MNYSKVHERGGKGIAKNIQDYGWRREERGQMYILYEVSKCERNKYNIIANN